MRRRLAALAVLGAGLAAGGCGGEDAPPDAAARLVPADALAYVHVDLADERLAATARRFPALGRLLDGLESLAGDGMEDWVGDEAALALLDSGGSAADTLLLLEAADPERAGRARPPAGVRAEMAGRFLAVGQARAVRRAVELSQGRGEGLDRTVRGAVDAWVPAAGVRRILVAQPGLLGAMGAALDDPRLRWVSASARVEPDGVRVSVRRARRGTAEAPTFEPELIERVPGDAAAYLGLAGAAPLLDRLGLSGLELGEVAIWVQPGLPVPVLTAIAEVDDERAARDAAARALGRLAQRVVGDRDASSTSIPQLEERRLPGGLVATVLPLGPGVEVAVAVAGGRLLASTSPAALTRKPAEDDALPRDERFERVVAEPDGEMEALGFADLSQLLTLGERVGLGSQLTGPARDDLRQIRAVGATAEREGSDTTAEFFFEIP